MATEPLARTLEHIAEQSPQASVQIYQGLYDENTITKPVLEFEAWNRNRRVQGLPAIRLSARYYAADHYLNLAALNDMIFALSAYLTP